MKILYNGESGKRCFCRFIAPNGGYTAERLFFSLVSFCMPAGMGAIRSALAQGCRQRSAPVFLLCVSFFAVNRRSVRYPSVRSFRKITRTKVPQHFDKIILYVYPPEKCSHKNG